MIDGLFLMLASFLPYSGFMPYFGGTYALYVCVISVGSRPHGWIYALVLPWDACLMFALFRSYFCGCLMRSVKFAARRLRLWHKFSEKQGIHLGETRHDSNRNVA